ncbi:MAG: hypothetical protein AAFX87_18160 [Bacteroidota bacterium]
MLLLVSFLLSFNAQVAGWELFADTRFKWEYDERIGMEVQIPKFSEKIRALEGTKVSLSGHYLPLQMEGNRIIISKLPYASCFFCGGGAGPESVAEVFFAGDMPRLKPDQIVQVKGKLKLNTYDLEHMVFILTDATVIKK